MNKLAHWIKSHQVTAFFIITFAISWGLGYTYILVVNKGKSLLAPLTVIALIGPALAGIIISALSNTQPKEGTKRSHWIAFVIAWVICVLVFLANNTFINHAPFSPIMLLLTLVSVVPVAFVLSMTYSRIPAVRNYLSSLIRLRGVWSWAALALVLTPMLALLSILINSLFGRQPIASQQLPELSLALIGLIAVKFLYQFFFFNATGEEAGWRGFALPRLQARISPLVACLILNLFWVLWHLFLWIAEGRPVFSLGYWAQTYLELLSGTVTLCWIYNRSKGSILVAGVAHAAANTAYWLFPNLDWSVFNWTAAGAALVMILVDRMWKKLPSDHLAVYHAPVLNDSQSSRDLEPNA
jgi:membrane protease YdiL (CAAX protease family)